MHVYLFLANISMNDSRCVEYIVETTIELFLTRTEAAQFAGVCERTISRWTERGFLTPVIGGHAMRFRREDVEEVKREHQKRHHWQAAS